MREDVCNGKFHKSYGVRGTLDLSKELGTFGEILCSKGLHILLPRQILNFGLYLAPSLLAFHQYLSCVERMYT